MKYAIVKSVYARLYNEDGTETVDDVLSGWMSCRMMPHITI